MIAPYYFKSGSDREAEKEKAAARLFDTTEPKPFPDDEATACGGRVEYAEKRLAAREARRA